MIFFDGKLIETPEVLRGPEADLTALLNASMVVWTGRAATALFWAYRLARRPNDREGQPEVIVPAVACLSPATAAIAAGCQVRFADADPGTGMATLDSIAERLTPATRAVVFIHLYGQTADLAPLGAWCRRHGVILIEDLAQAHGAMLPDGKAAGSVGDIAVYSFNRTKILECGGGALVLRSPALADVWRRLIDELPVHEIPSDAVHALATSQRDLYQSLVSLRRTQAVSDVSPPYLAVHRAYDGLYVRSLPHPPALAAAWNTLATELEARRAKAALYAARLDGGPWRILDGWRASGVCWRLTLLLDGPSSVRLTESVRRDKFHVSNLYWPLSDLMNPSDRCPDAEIFARRVLNLWVDSTVSPEWIERCCASMMAHA